MEFDLTRDPVPKDSHRPGVGWFALFILIGLLILVQLEGYLNRDVGKGDARAASNVERSLRMSMEYSAAMRGMLGQRAPQEDYSRLRSEIAPLEVKGAGEKAAIVAVAIRGLKGDERRPESARAVSRE